MTDTTNAAPQTIVQLVEGRKSLALALVLTLFFGPLGLLYVSVTWALVMTVLTFIVAFVTFGLGSLVMWPVALVLSLVLAMSHNGKLQRKMERAAQR